MNIKKIFNNFVIKLKRYFFLKRLRKRNKNINPTIISQNCIGGTIYKNLGLKFLSPTINVFLEDENFVKLVENLKYYMDQDAKPFKDNYVDPLDENIHYPIISVADIKICCFHYKNVLDAVNDWNRRSKRINYNNVFVIANTWNLHNDKSLIKRLNSTIYKTVIFAPPNFEINDETVFVLPQRDYFYIDKRGILRPYIGEMIPNSYKMYYEEFFDVVKFLEKK